MTKPAQLRDKNTDELRTEEAKLQNDLYKLRFQRATGRMENPSKMRQIRREIARIKTILGEKARG